MKQVIEEILINPSLTSGQKASRVEDILFNTEDREAIRYFIKNYFYLASNYSNLYFSKEKEKEKRLKIVLLITAAFLVFIITFMFR